MMMTLGFFVFSRQTLPYQTEQDDKQYRHAANSRIGTRPSYQFLGVGEQTKQLAGVLLPEITGGEPSLKQLEEMAETGKAYPLLDGPGRLHGMFVINGISTTKAELFSDGAARRIEFSVQLTRIDDRERALLGWQGSKNLINGMQL
ncbi:phage tail protein [Motilimonas sp. 1_MG-2023]|uniref:phage tail protein n=1 Tax=Motilimonas sp. 1_MG-2023 TaxID=3062672 RepID=UPI0026E3096E|nr:phage tail protein [Motilimonas sp. 1_MG-2023]MDO6525427.1 phage tail protein [Motilimonas sp. 1_MG-2023]